MVPPGTAVADPADDPQLLAETRDHYWIQFDTGSGFQDVDTAFAGAQIGQTFAPASATFAEVDDSLRQKTTIRFDAEITNTATALFGLPGQQTTTVLEKTFNDVDLVGRLLTIGNFVSTSGVGTPLFSETTNTYSPYLLVGEVGQDPSADEVIRGNGLSRGAHELPARHDGSDRPILALHAERARRSGRRSRADAVRPHRLRRAAERRQPRPGDRPLRPSSNRPARRLVDQRPAVPPERRGRHRHRIRPRRPRSSGRGTRRATPRPPALRRRSATP